MTTQRHYDNEKRVPYSRSYLPSSLSDAVARKDTLQAEITAIETQLEHRQAAAFPDYEAYDSWRRRAVAAIGHKRAEMSFLGTWHDEETQRQAARDQRQDATGRIMARARDLALEITELYTRKYIAASDISCLEDARSRQSDLARVETRINSALAELNKLKAEFGVADSVRVTARAVIHAAASGFEVEFAVVREYLKLNEPVHDQQHSLKEAAQAVRSRAVELADKIRKKYPRKYSTEVQPTSVEAARIRFAEINAARVEITAAYAEITDLWMHHRLVRDDMKTAKAPLRKLQSQIDAEGRVIKDYFRNASGGVHDDFSICLRALSRAVLGGFRLTSEEQNVFDRISAKSQRETLDTP